MPVLKRGIRILAIDDSFKRGEPRACIIGLIGRQGMMEGAITSSAEVDGTDATERIEKMIRGSRYLPQIGIIVTNGITVGGLNIVDICRLSDSLRVPVIAITRRRPRITALLSSMRRLDNYKERARIVKGIRERIRISRIAGYYLQSIGMDQKELKKFSEESIELLRIAHIIASGVVHGESKGRV